MHGHEVRVWRLSHGTRATSDLLSGTVIARRAGGTSNVTVRVTSRMSCWVSLGTVIVTSTAVVAITVAQEEKSIAIAATLLQTGIPAPTSVGPAVDKKAAVTQGVGGTGGAASAPVGVAS